MRQKSTIVFTDSYYNKCPKCGRKRAMRTIGQVVQKDEKTPEILESRWAFISSCPYCDVIFLGTFEREDVVDYQQLKKK